MATPHDALFKAIFASPDDAAGLIRPLLPAKAAAAINWSTLAVAPGSFVDEALRHRHADLLFSVRMNGRAALVFILLEHKSRGDRFTALYLLSYLVRIWMRWREQNPHAKYLPRIIPLVLHHGRRPWRAPTSLSGLFDPGDLDPASLAHLDTLGADLRFRVDDLATTDEDDLRTREVSPLAQLTLAFLRSLREADDTAALATMARWLDAVGRVLAAPGGGERIVVLWSYVLQVTSVPTEQLAALVATVGPDAEATLMSTANKLRAEGRAQGRTEGRSEGRSEGQIEGRADLLLRLLTQRFGPLPTPITDRVRAGTTADLDRWADAVLTAPSLDAVFAP